MTVLQVYRQQLSAGSAVDADARHAAAPGCTAAWQRDRRTILPQRFSLPMRVHLECMARQHAEDVVSGGGYVELPEALRRKLGDGAARGGDREAGDVSHLPSQLRYTPGGVGFRHPHDPGVAGA